MADPRIVSLLDAMWRDYVALNPHARRVHELFEARGEEVVNDHVALRTFALPPVGADVLARPFLDAGYVERGRYAFPEKKLVARHYEAAGLPKVFISELLVDELPRDAARLIAGLVDSVDAAAPSRPDFCSAGRPWRVSYGDYRALYAASDYAAWVAAFGYRANHFTVDVGALHTFASLAEVNAFLEQQGFVLNSSGGKIKGSAAELLEQSSILAEPVAVAFSDGTYEVPGCYYEFARRYRRPDGELYQGFIAASADKIFESTRGAA